MFCGFILSFMFTCLHDHVMVECSNFEDEVFIRREGCNFQKNVSDILRLIK
jgi:hypothetical protein